MFKTDKSALGAALLAATEVVKATGTIPILQNVLIERDGDYLVATGGSQDVEITARCQAAFADTFRPFTVSAARFKEIVLAAPENSVAVEAADDDLLAIIVKSGRSRLKLPTQPAIAYHKLKSGDLQHQLTISAETLVAALDGVAYAADTDIKTRAYLCGVFFDGEAEGLSLVATDGKRIERRLIPANDFDEGSEAVAAMPKVIVGSETVARIIKILKDVEEATLQVSAERIQLRAGDVVLTSKLVEGVYPTWRRLVPARNPEPYLLPVRQLIDAIGRVMIVNNDGGNGMRITFADQTMSLEARDLQGGDAREDMPLEFARSLIIGFHGRQLRDLLKHLKGDTAELHITGPMEPTLIHPVGDTANLCILIPMAVKGF